MKTVTITFNVDDAVARAVRHRVGGRGQATVKELEAEIRAMVYATFEDYLHEYRKK